MTHLGRDEMLRWRDEGGEGERSRVLGHLAACDTCRREYADLVRDAEPSGEAESLATEAVAAGMDAYPSAHPRAARNRSVVWAASGLAAAVLVGSALILITPPPHGDPPNEDLLRGEEIRIVAPAGTVSGPIAFQWSSPLRSTRFRVWVHDAGGAVVHSAISTEERLQPPPEVQSRLRPGQAYKWEVEAFDAAGERIARSREQDFTLAR